MAGVSRVEYQSASASPRDWSLAGKRTLDVSVALLLLLVLAPVMLLTGLVLRLFSPGPVFFCQERIGKEGRPFRMYKFRTMTPGADPTIHRQYFEALVRNGTATEAGKFKLHNDPRVTPVGRWLRRYSLDELPQLLNVVRGEMSLVGPRPAIPYEVALYGERELGRLAALPGITGLWQVNGRSLRDFNDMITLDLAYIECWSLWLDISILVRTPLVVLTGRGAD